MNKMSVWFTDGRKIEVFNTDFNALWCDYLLCKASPLFSYAKIEYKFVN